MEELKAVKEMQKLHSELLFGKDNGLLEKVREIRETQLAHDQLFNATLDQACPQEQRKLRVSEIMLRREIGRLTSENGRLMTELCDMQLKMESQGDEN